jgi:hypothetical protein
MRRHFSRKRRGVGQRTGVVGHWRKTTVSYESVKGEHLVFHTDGTVDNWVVPVSGPYEGRTSRTGTTTGHWIVQGKLLQIDGETSSPPVRFSSTRGNWFCRIFRTTANSGIGSSGELVKIRRLVRLKQSYREETVRPVSTSQLASVWHLPGCAAWQVLLREPRRAGPRFRCQCRERPLRKNRRAA